MRSLRRNSTDVKQEVERLWRDRETLAVNQARRWPAEDILNAVVTAHGTTVEAVRSYARDRATSLARHHAVWEMRQRRLDMTLRQIADMVHRVNHATALNSVVVFNEWVQRGHYAAERAAVAKALDSEA